MKGKEAIAPSGLLRWLPTVAATVAIAILLVIPAYQGMTETSGGGVTVRTQSSGTLLEANGPTALVALAFPLLIALMVLVHVPVRLRRGVDIASATVVSVFCILGSMTVGMFFIPTALTLVAVAVWGQ